VLTLNKFLWLKFLKFYRITYSPPPLGALNKLQESLDDMIRLRQVVSNKDIIIKDLRASKKSVAQELETARLAVKAAEETSATLRAQRDKAMYKAIRAGRILMRRPDMVVPDDIVADVNAAPDSSSRPSSSVTPEKNITK
jgi:hypothetical protein